DAAEILAQKRCDQRLLGRHLDGLSFWCPRRVTSSQSQTPYAIQSVMAELVGHSDVKRNNIRHHAGEQTLHRVGDHVLFRVEEVAWIALRVDADVALGG